MLPSLIRTRPLHPAASSAPPPPDDIFSAAVGTLFTDDVRIAHGDADTLLEYARAYPLPSASADAAPADSSSGSAAAQRECERDLAFEAADARGARDRAVFAHWLWNAGVLLGELVGGTAGAQRRSWGERTFADGRAWWVGEAEARDWSVAGHAVLELGAGA